MLSFLHVTLIYGLLRVNRIFRGYISLFLIYLKR